MNEPWLALGGLGATKEVCPTHSNSCPTSHPVTRRDPRENKAMEKNRSLLEALSGKPAPRPNWFEHFIKLGQTTGKRPSDIVQVSGIYKVEHDTVHTQPHEVTCVKDEKFPPCRNCGNKITYSLVTA